MSEIKEIPKHWEIKKLGEVCDKLSLNKIKIKQKDYLQQGKFPVIDQGQELIGGFYNDEKFVVPNEPPYIIFGDHTKVKKFIPFKFIAGADGVKVLKSKSNTDPKFLYYVIQTIKIEDKGYARHFQLLEKSDFPLPPLPEQQAIVAKIEELLSELENGKQQLLTAQQQLKVYRQSLLKWAFEGKLTKSWRESKSDLPTADDLFIQIEKGKERFYQNQLKECENELKLWIKSGQVGKKPSKPKALTQPDKPNVQQNEKKWDIPKNWIWTQMGTLCFVTKLAGFEYTDYVKYDENGDLSVLKAENVGLMGFKETVFSKVKTDSIKMLTRSQLFGGEIIIVFVGAGTGNVAMVPFNLKYFLGPNIGMARPYFKINSKYLELFYQSIFGKNLMLSAVKAVAQPSLSMGTIRQTPIAFPSIEEQDKIVEELESKLTVCDKIEETISQSLQQAETLRQSILKKAFEGRLVTTEKMEVVNELR